MPGLRRAEGSVVENPAAIQKRRTAALSEGDRKHIPKLVIVKECGLIPGRLVLSSCTDRRDRARHAGEALHPLPGLLPDYRFISRVWLSPVHVIPPRAAPEHTKGK